MTSRILTGTLALALLATGSWVMTRGGGDAPLLPAAAQAQDVTAAVEPEYDPENIQIVDMALGAEDAPVTVIEYASYTCPHCAHFHDEQFPRLKADYVDTGKVRFIYREAYFDRPSLWASMLARCGGEMRYWGMQDELFDNQRDWIGDGNLAGIAERLRRLGVAAGMDTKQVDSCMADAATAQALVTWYEENRAADEIEATPSFIINGKKYANRGYESLSEAIEAALAAGE